MSGIGTSIGTPTGESDDAKLERYRQTLERWEAKDQRVRHNREMRSHYANLYWNLRRSMEFAARKEAENNG